MSPTCSNRSKALTAKPQILFLIPHIPQRQAMQDVITRRSREQRHALLTLTKSTLPRDLVFR